MNQIAKTTAATVAEPQNLLPADPYVSMIERVAMDPNSDLAKLERMLEMKFQLEERESRRAFDQAIASAKSEIPPILKTGEVDYINNKGQRTNFKHETLDGIAKIVDPILSQNGLSYRFRSEQKEGALHVTCIVAHRDGHSEETTLQGAPDTSGSKNAYQAVGSAATYLQRYTLKLALGLSAAKDDDASAATPGSDPITEEQFRELQDMIERIGVDESILLTAEKIQSLELLPAAKFKAVRKNLEISANNRGVKL